MREYESEEQAFARMTRAELHAHAQHYFKSGGATEPEVALVVCAQARAIFKDYGRTPGWFGRVVAPLLIWREASALTQLAGLDGIPQLYRRVDGRGLLMEYMPATAWPLATAPEAAYPRLDALVAAMHARGIAHGDLRAPSNMLVTADGRPCIVDFVARVRQGRRWNLPWNWLFRQFVCVDDSALAKLRSRYAPQLLTEADRAFLGRRGPMERLARGIGQRTRRLVRFLVRS